MALPELGQFITADLEDIDLTEVTMLSFGWPPMALGELSMTQH